MRRYFEKLARMTWSERLIHVLFDVGAIAKGVDGVLEIIGGALLFVVDPHQLHHLARILLQHELSEDPHDVVATYLLHTSQHVAAGTVTFAAAYLLWHGVVKVGLVAGLLLRQRWAYPTAIGAFLLFLVYQLYRYTHTYAPELLVLSAFDVFIIVLTWLEYGRLRAAHAFA
jgi:uncharacterized membrane protein